MKTTTESLRRLISTARTQVKYKTNQVLALTLTESVEEPVDRLVKIFVGLPQQPDFVDGMQNGSVMLPAELPADFGKRSRSELFNQKHRDLARKRNLLRVAAHLQILSAQTEMLAHTFLNLFDGDFLVLRFDDVFQNLLRRRQINHRAGKRSVGHQTN